MNEEYPFLNLDKATSLYLPLEPIESRADYRFAFRLANGDEEWLLVRLCAVDSAINGKSWHVVVLRPENAEASRVFVLDFFEYRSGRRKIGNLMTEAAARKFKWDLFEQYVNKERRLGHLGRFWCMKKGEVTVLIKLFPSSGQICGYVSETENSIAQYKYHDSHFYWRRVAHSESGRVTELKFLRLSDAGFKRKLRSLWKNENSELRGALRWAELSDEDRDAIAFECKQGNWEELRNIARLVLQLRVAALKQAPQSSFYWKFGGYAHIAIHDVPELNGDDALFLWRLALTHTFGTTNFDIDGRKRDSLPYFLLDYILTHDKTFIEASMPSNHELLEASLDLEEWAKANFPHEMARILIDSLHSFSEENARFFVESLNEINLV